ncbi:MAG: hypothetical protein FJ388_20440 [Verrucomicrobia bacterium]|nr:hypothetical protein [Verrucomicrobiota bacterium]
MQSAASVSANGPASDRCYRSHSQPQVDTSKPRSPGPLIEIQKRGDPASKVDLLILGDGYTVAESGKFEKDAQRLAEVLFAISPFKERRDDFNVWGLCPPAMESGIPRPSWGVHKRSPVGAAYDAFGSDRYILTFENRSFRAIASFAPYEFAVILANDKPYGGGGIFNLFATVAADNPWAPAVFVHEFGHHFAALGDEYFATPGAYPPPTAGVEPWEPNATATHDLSNLKWKDLADASTPLPTPWNKEAFEAYAQGIEKRYQQLRIERKPEQEIDALFQEEKTHVTRALASEKYAGKVGAFEGALCHPKGYFRPQLDCIMFSRNDAPFCAVCRRAIERVINLYAG